MPSTYTPSRNAIPRVGEMVTIIDGPRAQIIKISMRKCSNGGPGCRVYTVRDENGTVRKYPINALHRHNALPPRECDCNDCVRSRAYPSKTQSSKAAARAMRKPYKR